MDVTLRLLLAAFVLGTLGIAAFWRIDAGRRSAALARLRALYEASLEARAAIETAHQGAADERLAAVAEAAKARLEAAEAVATANAHREWHETLNRKLRENGTVIEGVVKERDVWHDLYMTACREYGAAQHMCFVEIERLALLANVAKDPVVSTVQAQLRADAEAAAARPLEEHKVPPLPEMPEALRIVEAAIGKGPA